jgi:GNAT superfamily N-acetyltransferase
MNIEIKRLAPDLISDYTYFFENVAPLEDIAWGVCYCVWFHWSQSLDIECKQYERAGGTCFKRDLAIRYIKEGILQGYLAYVDGSVAGWCNANDKCNYASLTKQKHPEYWDDVDTSGKVKSIVCYNIAPDMRRKGIATKLLDRVCSDAAWEGYRCVEAYPGKGHASQYSYQGSLSTYEKNGFAVYKDLGYEIIVRRYF